MALDQRRYEAARFVSLVGSDAEGRLSPDAAFSRWAPLWAFLGIGLPISFAVQVRPALMSHRPHELLAIYATEWLLLCAFALLIAGSFAALDILTIRLGWRVQSGRVSCIVFAVIVAVVLLFGSIAWVTTFQHLPPPSLRPWTAILACGVLVVGGLAASGRLSEQLAALARLGRIVSLIGALTLVSLPVNFSAGVVPAAPGSGTLPVGAGPKPNIVLISIDALTATHLLPYGSSRQTSPQIAAFASNALVFDRFYANSNFTTASIASILTGVAPWTHRVLGQTGKADAQSIRESFPALLHASGYLTAYFASNPWAGAREQGFGEFFDHKDSKPDWVFGPCFDRWSEVLPYLCEAASSRLISYSYSALEHAAAALGLISLDPHSNVAAMTERASRWTEAAGKLKAPVFMWIHLFPPHDPYAAPKPWLGKFDPSSAASTPADSHPAIHFEAGFESASHLATLEARYDESIAYVDHYVGDLIAAVNRNLGSNTVIVLTADHGESFDHGYGSHSGVMLYEDLIHIPLIIARPGQSPGRRQDLASQIDIAPTIAEFAGIAPPPRWEGRSLVAEPRGNPITFASNFEENRSYGALTTGATTVLRSNWKYVHFLGDPRYPNMPRLQDQLFDLQADPHEGVNLALAQREIVANMQSLIDEQIARHGGDTGG